MRFFILFLVLFLTLTTPRLSTPLVDMGVEGRFLFILLFKSVVLMQCFHCSKIFMGGVELKKVMSRVDVKLVLKCVHVNF